MGRSFHKGISQNSEPEEKKPEGIGVSEKLGRVDQW